MTADSRITLPGELVTHVSEILGDEGRSWLAGLPDTIRLLEKKWSIEVEAPFSAAEFNFVAPAVRDKTEPVVLKLCPPYPDRESYSEAAYLRNGDGWGCVRLLAHDREDRAIMIERALPGRNLAEEFADRKTESIAPAIAVLRAVQSGPPEDLTDVLSLDKWFEGLQRHAGTDFDHDYAEKALDIYDRLSQKSKTRYIHGDFHPGNIVSATRAPYLAIDPKGVVGSLGYDIAVFLNNYHWWHLDVPDIHEPLDDAVRQFSLAFDISETELREWAFATQVIGAWWTYEDMPSLYDSAVAKADVWGV